MGWQFLGSCSNRQTVPLLIQMIRRLTWFFCWWSMSCYQGLLTFSSGFSGLIAKNKAIDSPLVVLKTSCESFLQPLSIKPLNRGFENIYLFKPLNRGSENVYLFKPLNRGFENIYLFKPLNRGFENIYPFKPPNETWLLFILQTSTSTKVFFNGLDLNHDRIYFL